jgi:hypothetical protein
MKISSVPVAPMGGKPSAAAPAQVFNLEIEEQHEPDDATLHQARQRLAERGGSPELLSSFDWVIAQRAFLRAK